jgi:superfamily I DNA/RNA helicase/mRNA-degrading endonuclease RelE of RelBE toxin-antitoxin system
MASRELSIKASCTHEIHGLNKETITVFWEKIDFLLKDPLPDGAHKKKLAGYDDLYRLRVGSFRVFYSFGSDWVRLLAIRQRKEAYSKKNAAIAAETPNFTPTASTDDALDDALADEEERSKAPPTFSFDASSSIIKLSSTPLPQKLTVEWLQEIRIPEACIGQLVQCTSEEQLLACKVPDQVLQRVVENIYPKAVAEILSQPNLRVGSLVDLVRFKEGTLSSFLLQLDVEQEKLIDWALKGPTLVRGGAGTGKSTVALYRVRALLRRPGAKPGERVLFATYTSTLRSISEQLLQQILDPSELARVRVATCDEIARQIVAGRRQIGPKVADAREVLREIRKGFSAPGATPSERKLRTAALARLSDGYLLDEFAWVIEGRDLTTLEAYQAAARPGRSVPFGAKMREAIWALWETFRGALGEQNAETFGRWRREALQYVMQKPDAHAYDFVLIDEAQDLSPVTMRLMAHLARTPEGICFAADDKQSIYTRGFGYADVDPRLQFKGRTAILDRNYRSTAEIDRAAFSMLTPDEGQTLTASLSPHHGPTPVLLRGVKPGEEGKWAAKFLLEMGRFLRVRPGAAAVLVPDKATGEAVAKAMTSAGLEAQYVKSDAVDLSAGAVRVLTMHSAKGLEFPSVVVIPRGGPAQAGGEGEEIEAEQRRRRLLYVAMTRAMRGLLVMQVKGDEDPLLSQLPTDPWNVVEAGASR